MTLGKVGKENEKVNKRFINCLGDVLEHYPLESERVLTLFPFYSLCIQYTIHSRFRGRALSEYSEPCRQFRYSAALSELPDNSGVSGVFVCIQSTVYKVY